MTERPKKKSAKRGRPPKKNAKTSNFCFACSQRDRERLLAVDAKEWILPYVLGEVTRREKL